MAGGSPVGSRNLGQAFLRDSAEEGVPRLSCKNFKENRNLKGAAVATFAHESIWSKESRQAEDICSLPFGSRIYKKFLALRMLVQPACQRKFTYFFTSNSISLKAILL